MGAIFGRFHLLAYLSRNIFKVHKMLYTFEKTFHEQTLSFAAENPGEKSVERCSPAPEFVEAFDHWSSRTVWTCRVNCGRACRFLYFQACDFEIKSRGRCLFACRLAFVSHAGQAQRNSAATFGPQ